jgi:hypothetical protein
MAARSARERLSVGFNAQVCTFNVRNLLALGLYVRFRLSEIEQAQALLAALAETEDVKNAGASRQRQPRAKS